MARMRKDVRAAAANDVEALDALENRLDAQIAKVDAASMVTMSINGGPHVPVATVKQALEIVKGNNSEKRHAGGVEATRLRAFVERIEKLEEEKAGIGGDVRDTYAEAKANGFCTKTMRQIIKLRRMKPNERTEQDYMLDLYKRALGMQMELDLGENE